MSETEDSQVKSEATPPLPLQKMTRESIVKANAGQLTRFKALWKTQFTEEEKEYWIEALGTKLKSNLELVAEIKVRHEVDFGGKSQISKLRSWVAEQAKLLELTQEMEDDEEFLAKRYPNASKDEIREKLLLRTYARVLKRGDFQLFIKVARTDVQVDNLQLNRDKFKESSRTKIQAGLDALRKAAKKDHAIQTAVEQLCNTVKRK